MSTNGEHSPITVQILPLIDPNKPCKACAGTGYDFNQLDNKCPVCKGLKLTFNGRLKVLPPDG